MTHSFTKFYQFCHGSKPGLGALGPDTGTGRPCPRTGWFHGAVHGTVHGAGHGHCQGHPARRPASEAVQLLKNINPIWQVYYPLLPLDGPVRDLHPGCAVWQKLGRVYSATRSLSMPWRRCFSEFFPGPHGFGRFQGKMIRSDQSPQFCSRFSISGVLFRSPITLLRHPQLKILDFCYH